MIDISTMAIAVVIGFLSGCAGATVIMLVGSALAMASEQDDRERREEPTA